MKFRKDINGLRAIAVIAVVLFHFNPAWLPGGFAGVDVFFVISGFLMTGIIFRGIEQNNFSLIRFYFARANRIIPALAALSLVLLAFGWFYLTPLDYKALGKHVAGSMSFISNMLYWRESGYFDAASLEKWLLHTWSLSVEWQFYIIYPIILIAAKKFFSEKSIKPIILIGTALSFMLCVIVTYSDPSAAYYLLPIRAWEMLMGGVAYLYPLALSVRNKKAVERVGFTLIISSYFFVSSTTPWPGYLAFLPVLGSFLIIQSQRNDSFITGNLVFQKIGLWSYSIYLWHWPLVVAISYFSLGEKLIYPGMLLSIMLGWASYQYIEKIKFNNSFTHSSSYLTSKPIYLGLITCLLGGTLYYHYNVQLKSIDNLGDYHMAGRDNGYCFGTPGAEAADEDYLNCQIGLKNKPANVLLFGDSFAGHFEPLLDIIGNNEQIAIDAITTNSCYPAFSKNFNGHSSHLGYEQCMMNREYVQKNIEQYDVVFISARWDSFLGDWATSPDEVLDMVAEITSKNITVVYLPNPTVYKRNVGDDYISHLMGGPELDQESFSVEEYRLAYTKKIENRLEKLASRNKNFIFINKEKFFPNHLIAKAPSKIPYSADGAHISILAAKQLEKNFTNSENYKDLKNIFNSFSYRYQTSTTN